MQEKKPTKRKEFEDTLDLIQNSHETGLEKKANFSLEMVKSQLEFEKLEVLQRIALSLERIQQVGIKNRRW